MAAASPTSGDVGSASVSALRARSSRHATSDPRLDVAVEGRLQLLAAYDIDHQLRVHEVEPTILQQLVRDGDYLVPVFYDEPRRPGSKSLFLRSAPRGCRQGFEDAGLFGVVGASAGSDQRGLLAETKLRRCPGVQPDDAGACALGIEDHVAGLVVIDVLFAVDVPEGIAVSHDREPVRLASDSFSHDEVAGLVVCGAG